MNKYFLLSLTVVLAASLGVAPVAQADLVSLTLILAAVWTSGVVVNETIISKEDKRSQETAQSSVGDSQLAVAQTQSD